jgi:hypothetical protein
LRFPGVGPCTPQAYNGADWGLWQIDSVHGPAMATFDVNAKATAVIELSANGTDWSQWMTYRNGAYLSECIGSYRLPPPPPPGPGPLPQPVPRAVLRAGRRQAFQTWFARSWATCAASTALKATTVTSKIHGQCQRPSARSMGREYGPADRRAGAAARLKATTVPTTTTNTTKAHGQSMGREYGPD